MIKGYKDRFVNRETVSYTFFGVLTTAVNWAVFTLLLRIGADYRIATAAAWAVSVMFAFVVNKLFVFQSRSLQPVVVLRELASFGAGRVITGAMEFFLMILLVSVMSLEKFMSKVLVSVLVLVLNYVFSKFFIFKEGLLRRNIK